MTSPSVRAFAPGRVTLVGEHTDYNAGLSLPFAIELGVAVTATPRSGRDLVVDALDLGERDVFPLRAPAPTAGWRAFGRGVAAELAAAGHRLAPAHVEIAGTVRAGAGLGSSAALAVALSLALLALSGEPEPDRRALAELCSRVENRWVGARTGLLDQTASLLGRAGHALRIDFAARTAEHVPLPTGAWTLAVLDSGEARSHAAARGYNERRAECAAACEQLGIAALRDARAEALTALPDRLRHRARHVLEENRRVDATVAALQTGDWPRVAALLDAAHASLRDLYEVSTPAVEAAVARLRRAGARGARLVGGGFGGHVLGVFPPGTARPPDALVVAAGPGARLL